MTFTFLARATWRATAKLFLVKARDMESAQLKAEKSREAIGAWEVKVLHQKGKPT